MVLCSVCFRCDRRRFIGKKISGGGFEIYAIYLITQLQSATPTVNYTADALNRYTAVGSVSPTYDGNSNLTFDGTFTFGYDAENRLTSASGAGNIASYTWDAQGRRKTRTVNGATTVFVTDAGNREVLEYDGTSGAIQRWYAYGLGANEVLNQSNVVAGTRAAFVPDIQGSVIASLDFELGQLQQDRLSALRQERQRRGPVRLYRPAHRSRDQRALLLPRAALFAGVGEVPTG